MRFLYEYRTRENIIQKGEVAASDRDAAYRLLRAQGIRPSRVEQAPGFFNALFGKGKRWLTIGLLSLVVAVLAVVVVRQSRNSALRELCEERAQIYGEPEVLSAVFAEDCSSVFADVGDRYLADHAVPGRPCHCSGRTGSWREEVASALAKGMRRMVEPNPADLAEVGKLKRMVNGMKRELAQYCADGGDVLGYMDRLDLRLKVESGIVDRYRSKLRTTSDTAEWRRRNTELRAMGLPMIERAGNFPSNSQLKINKIGELQAR